MKETVNPVGIFNWVSHEFVEFGFSCEFVVAKRLGLFGGCVDGFGLTAKQVQGATL